MSLWAMKVSPTLDRSIILAAGVIELDAYPQAWFEMCVPVEADYPLSPTEVLDSRPRGEFRHAN